MTLEKTLRLKGIDNRYPIIQGGMGIGISLYRLASEVGAQGCVGTISSVALDQFTARRLGSHRMDHIEAAMREIADTRERGGVAAINVMCAVASTYEQSVEGALRGGVNLIISGAGLPMQLPTLVERIAGTKDHAVNLVPIVSSDRALQLICKRWDKQGYRPDAVVLEGPRAGGHIGWSYKQVTEAGERFLEEYDLFDVLLDPVLDVANAYKNDFGPIPVFVGGGIFTQDDIRYALARGAAGVQMGTRFAATEESGGTDEFKQTIVNSKKEDIVLADESWGSPCGLPFRYIRTSALAAKERIGEAFCICTTLFGAAGIDNTSEVGSKEYPAGCPERYVLLHGKVCKASGHPDYSALVTCGTEAYRVDKVMKVADLVDELVK